MLREWANGGPRRGVVLAAAVAIVIAACAPTGAPLAPEPTVEPASPGTTPLASTTRPTTRPPIIASDRLLMTYYFYWYDAATGGHLEPQLLNQHFAKGAAPSWRDVAWHSKELADMSYAGIDVALPVYWGFDRPQDEWSTKGLEVLGRAWSQMAQRGERPPRIGMFLDTSIIDMRDLTSTAGKQWFYANFKDFFSRVPRDQWATVDGRPIAFLFTSDFTAAMDQSTFDHVYQRFQADFGTRPYIVREVSWNEPIVRWENGERVRDKTNLIRTEASYVWAAAIHGYRECCSVAAVGPGFDERGLPGRSGDYTDRRGGAFYRRSFDDALRSGHKMIVIETWNEMHEASGICESLEFGRSYLDITREYAARFHAIR